MTDNIEKSQNQKKFKTVDIVYIGLSAALITICAWINIPLTVPVTLQTLGICLVAGLFGTKRGTLATIIYVILGFIGVPVFAGFKGGIAAVLGSTGGYIVGFIFTALITGIFADKFKGRLVPLLIGMSIGVIACYIFGTAWFALVYAKQGTPESIATILGWCVIPFIIPDIVKIVIAALLTNKLKKFVK